MAALERSPTPESQSPPAPSSVSGCGHSQKAAIQLIKCTSEGCLPPKEVTRGEIKAQQLSVREAHIRWKERPRSVLVLKKWRDRDVTRQTVHTVLWIMRKFGVTVYMDAEQSEWGPLRRFIRHTERRRIRGGKPTRPGFVAGRDPLPTAESDARDASSSEPGAAVASTMAGPCAESNVGADGIHPLTGTSGLLPYVSACCPTLDLILCLGGDGTVLHLSSLFQGPMPPVISLSAGSLGFMTVFNKERLRDVLRAIFCGVKRGSDAMLTHESPGHPSPGLTGITEATTLPKRAGSVLQIDSATAQMPSLGLDLLTPPSIDDDAAAVAGTTTPPHPPSRRVGSGLPVNSNGSIIDPSASVPPPAVPSPVLPGHDAAAVPVTMRMRLMCAIHRKGQKQPDFVRLVLNEITLERGLRPLAAIDAYVDGEPLTTIYADGVIVATPTGSTAYSLAAGGTMALPNVPAILFTPICPHSLSFRPLMMPDSATIKLVVPPDARGTVRINLDGRVPDGLSQEDCELHEGDFVVIRMSRYPLPLVTRKGTVSDWVRSITEKLNWNVRERQKALSGDAGVPTGITSTMALLDSDSESDWQEEKDDGVNHTLGAAAPGKHSVSRRARRRHRESGYSSDEDDEDAIEDTAEDGSLAGSSIAAGAASETMPSRDSLSALHAPPNRWSGNSSAMGHAAGSTASHISHTSHTGPGDALLSHLRASVHDEPPPSPAGSAPASPIARPGRLQRATSDDNPTRYNRPRRHNSTYGYIE